ncbi:MAG: UxaA family hydrolase [Mangrovibacterium sp.]
MADYIKINSIDNVIIALKDYAKGEIADVDGYQIELKGDVGRGHKIAIQPIAEGENVIKYGAPIGHATTAISIGEKVHVENTKTNLSGTICYEYNPKFQEVAYQNQNLTFKGFKRNNGDVGIRNELWIVPTVGCVNGQAEQIIRLFKEKYDTTSIDDIHVFKHAYGCSQLGDDHVNTQKALAQLINHPNAGGVLVLGLGCENNQISSLKEFIGKYDERRVKFLVAQEVEDEVAEGLKLFEEIYATMRHDVREDVPFSKLRVGLKCGGSDGLSGITANPLVGAFSDFLIAQGGTTILTEVPEMFGAEHLLMERCETVGVFEKAVEMINGFKEYYLSHNLPVYENPSPGNKNGGITTLEDKSLGCTQKGGVATVVDVLKYAEPISKNGLNLLSAPGNDLVAASSLGFSGCQIVLFTTGRGTPFGSFIPTMKISTNTPLFEKKSNWIDFNAGRIVEDQTIDECLQDFVVYLKAVAEGERLKHENSGFKEIAIFKTGVTL